jgi:hypothetical protein
MSCDPYRTAAFRGEQGEIVRQTFPVACVIGGMRRSASS